MADENRRLAPNGNNSKPVTSATTNVLTSKSDTFPKTVKKKSNATKSISVNGCSRCSDSCRQSRVPPWTIVWMRMGVVPIVILLGAIAVSAIGYTGSVLSVDTAAANMMNATATILNQEIRATSLRFAAMAEINARVYVRSRRTLSDAILLKNNTFNYFDESSLNMLSQHQWTATRRFLGKRLVDTEVLWTEIWNPQELSVLGASRTRPEIKSSASIYEYNMSSCAQFFAWDLQHPSLEEVSKATSPLRTEMSTLSGLGELSCNVSVSGDCLPVSTECFDSQLWTSMPYIADITEFDPISGQYLPNLEALRPRWSIFSRNEVLQFDLHRSLPSDVQNIAVIVLPIVDTSMANERSNIYYSVVAIDAAAFLHNAATALATSGLGDRRTLGVANSGYALSDGGCFGVGEVSSSKSIWSDTETQSVNAVNWKNSILLPTSDMPGAWPIPVCSAERVEHMISETKKKVASFFAGTNYKEDDTIKINTLEPFGRVMEEVISWWPIQEDSNPGPKTTANFYRSAWASDASGGDAVLLASVNSIYGWPLESFNPVANTLQEKDDAVKFAADGALPIPVFDLVSETSQRVLPPWSILVVVPRARVSQFLRSQVSVAIATTLTVMLISSLIVLYVRIDAEGESFQATSALMRFAKRVCTASISTKTAKQVEAGQSGHLSGTEMDDVSKNPSNGLADLGHATIAVMLVTLALLIFLVFVASAAWSRATDDMAMRTVRAASTAADRAVEHLAQSRTEALRYAGDLRDVYFLADDTMLNLIHQAAHNDTATLGFFDSLRSDRLAFEQTLSADLRSSDFSFNSTMSALPTSLLTYQFVRYSAIVAYVDVVTAYTRIGTNMQAIGADLITLDSTTDDHFGAEPITMLPDALNQRNKILNDITNLANLRNVTKASPQKWLGSISLFLVDSSSRGETIRTNLYPVVHTCKLKIQHQGFSSSISTTCLRSPYASTLALISASIGNDLIGPIARRALDLSGTQKNKFEDEWRAVDKYLASCAISMQTVGTTTGRIDASELPWREMQLFQKTERTHGLAQIGSMTTDQKQVSASLAASAGLSISAAQNLFGETHNLTASLFSYTWTNTHTFWGSFPISSSDRGMPPTGTELMDNSVSDTRVYSGGVRGLSLSRTAVQRHVINATALHMAWPSLLENIANQFFHESYSCDTYYFFNSVLGSSCNEAPQSNAFTFAPLSPNTTLNIWNEISQHTDVSLGAMSGLLAGVQLRFGAKSSFSSTSIFDASGVVPMSNSNNVVDAQDVASEDAAVNPTRLILTEGPLRLARTLDTEQIAPSRLLVFSTAHDRALTPGPPAADKDWEPTRDSALSRVMYTVQQYEQMFCTSNPQSSCPMWPARSLSLSPLIAGAGGVDADGFSSIIRPAAILLGASHGSVLNSNSDLDLERMFVIESNDVFISTASLQIAANVKFFEYGSSANSLSQLGQRLSEYSGPSEVNYVGVGSRSEFVASTHVSGGATGMASLSASAISAFAKNDFSENLVLIGKSQRPDVLAVQEFQAASLMNSLRIGSDLDVFATGLVRVEDLKEESDSWQWALFLFALGPLLTTVFLAATFTSWLHTYFKTKTQKSKLISSKLEQTSDVRSSTVGDNGFTNDQNERLRQAKLRLRTIALFASRTGKSRSSMHASSLSLTLPSTPNQRGSFAYPNSHFSKTRNSVIDSRGQNSAAPCGNQSANNNYGVIGNEYGSVITSEEPLLEPDPNIESAMHAVHGTVATVYDEGSRWDSYQQYRIVVALDQLAKHRPSLFTWFIRCCLCRASRHSNHTANVLAGLPISELPSHEKQRRLSKTPAIRSAEIELKQIANPLRTIRSDSDGSTRRVFESTFISTSNGPRNSGNQANESHVESRSAERTTEISPENGNSTQLASRTTDTSENSKPDQDVPEDTSVSADKNSMHARVRAVLDGTTSNSESKTEIPSNQNSTAASENPHGGTQDMRWQASIFRRAREFIHMYASDRHVLEAVMLEKQGRWKSEALHRIFSTSTYKALIYLTTIVLLCLAFFEASRTVVSGGAQSGVDIWVAPCMSNVSIGCKEFYSSQSYSPSINTDALQVEIGAVYDGAEQLPTETSTDGRKSWSSTSSFAFNSGSLRASIGVNAVNELRARILGVEIFAFLILLTDAILFGRLKGLRKNYYVLYDVDAARKSPEVKSETLSQRSISKLKERAQAPPVRLLFVARTAILFVMFLDLFIRIFVDYRTGRSATLLPYTVLLRPIYAILRVSSVRRSLQALGQTVLLARRTFTLFFTFIVVIAAVSMAMLSGYTDLGSGPYAAVSPSPTEALPFATLDDTQFDVSSISNNRYINSVSSSDPVARDGAIAAAHPWDVAAVSSPALGRGFTNFQSSWITMFILATSGENYVDIVYPEDDPKQDGGFLGAIYRPYFVFIALAGVFIISSLMLVSFQRRYTACYEMHVQELTNRRRLAPLVAFALLDLNGNGVIDRSEYETFFKACGVKRHHYEGLGERLNATEFVYVCEYLMVQLRFDFESGSYRGEKFMSHTSSRVRKGLKKRRWVALLLRWRGHLKAFFENRTSFQFNNIVLIVVVLHAWIVTLLGTRFTSYVDPVLGGFLFLQSVEVLLRILSLGWIRFWFGKRKRRVDTAASALAQRAQKDRTGSTGNEAEKSRQHLKIEGQNSSTTINTITEDDDTDMDVRTHYQLSANRFDFVVIAFALFLIFATSFLDSKVQGGTLQDAGDYSFAKNIGMRVAITLPVLRLFSVVRSTRRLVFGLLKQSPRFAPVSALILLSMYIFAVFGVWIFGGQYARLSSDSYGITAADFDDFSSALTTLFLVMEGESWHDVAYAAIDARNSLIPIFFFVIFVMINGLLFTNLFVGMVCDTFTEVEDTMEDSGDNESNKLLD